MGRGRDESAWWKPRASRGVASHPSRIGEISVSARNPPLRRRCPPRGLPLAPPHPPSHPLPPSCKNRAGRVTHAAYCRIVGCNLAKRFTATQRNPSRAHVLTSSPPTRHAHAHAHAQAHARARVRLPHAFTRTRLPSSVSTPRENPSLWHNVPLHTIVCRRRGALALVFIFYFVHRRLTRFYSIARARARASHLS